MSPSEYQELVEFVAGQFDKMRARFDQMDARFDQVDARFDQVDARFDQVDARFQRVEDRLTRVEVTGEDTRHKLELVIERVDFLDAKVERLRHDMNAEFVSVRGEIRGMASFWGRRVEALEVRVDRLEAP
jgi:archaellum component FlaC